MKTKGYWAAIVCMASIFIACNENKIKPVARFPMDVNHAFFVANGMPQSGKTLKIIYNKYHTEAKYKGYDDELFLGVYVSTKYNGPSYRIRMAPAPDNDSLLQAEFTVPENAVYVAMDVGPKDTYIAEEHLSGPVLNDAGDPVESALPQAIFRAPEFSLAKTYFQLDAYLYPQSVERYVPYWRGIMESGNRGEYVKREVDSACNAILDEEDGSERCFTMYCAGAMAYTMLDEPAASLHALRRARAWLRAHPDHRLTDQQKHALGALCWDILEVGGAVKKLWPKDSAAHVLRELFSLAIESRDLALGNSIAIYPGKNLPRRYKLPLVQFAETLERLTDAASEVDLYPTANSHFMILTTYSDSGRYDQALKMANKAIDRFTAFEALPYADPKKPVRELSYSSQIHSWMLQKGHILCALGDTLAAIAIYRSFADSYTGGRSEGSQLASAFYNLSEKYASLGKQDSAEKYYAYTVQMNSPSADSLLKTITAFRSRRRLPPLDVDKLNMRYPLNFATDYKAPVMMFQTQNGPLSLQSRDDRSFLIVFSNSSCGVCHRYLPAMLDDLRKDFGADFRVVLVTDENADRVKKMYKVDLGGSGVYLVKDGKKYNRPFFVQGYPSLFVVRSGRVIYDTRGLGPGTGKTIRGILAARNRTGLL